MFTDATVEGFLVEKVRENFLEAKYIQKMEFTQNVTDPLGKTIELNRIDFRQYDFLASSEPPYFELLNPPRSLTRFMNVLSNILDFQLFIKLYSIDVLKWANTFQLLSGADVIVDAIQINNFEIERGVNAKITIKGNKDIIAVCSDWAQGYPHNIEKIRLKLLFGRGASLLLSNSGNAKMEYGDEAILSKLRQSLVVVSA